MATMVTETALTPAAPSFVAKEVIRCRTCQLNQFMTRQGICRRCHQPLMFEEPTLAASEFVQPAASAGPPRPAVDIATAIWMLRTARGMSQRVMAKKMGIARTYISKLESARCMPSAGQIRRIADTLEVSEYCLVAMATAHAQHAVKQ